jgi:hypothetical protein
MAVFYGLHPDAMFGTRLKNWLVFGGCAMVGAGTLSGMAWQHLARWLA